MIMAKYIFQIILISNNEKGIFIVAATILMLSSCATVSEYQRMYINDSDMELSLRTGKNLNMLFSCTEKELQEQLGEIWWWMWM